MQTLLALLLRWQSFYFLSLLLMLFNIIKNWICFYINNSLPSLAEEDVREAALQYVGEHCCYGSGAAKDMVITNITMMSAFHVSQFSTFGQQLKMYFKWMLYISCFHCFNFSINWRRLARSENRLGDLYPTMVSDLF